MTSNDVYYLIRIGDLYSIRRNGRYNAVSELVTLNSSETTQEMAERLLDAINKVYEEGMTDSKARLTWI